MCIAITHITGRLVGEFTSGEADGEKGKNKEENPKIQLSARVFQSQKKRLRRKQYEWGYGSLDRALRGVLKEYGQDEKQWKTKYETLVYAIKQAGLVPEKPRQFEEIIHHLGGFEYEAGAVKRYIQFKVNELNWDPDLALVELKHLPAYVHWRDSGELPVLENGREAEDGNSPGFMVDDDDELDEDE